MSSPTVLYLIEILHQTTTLRTDPAKACRCILSKFYIKPQPVAIGGGKPVSCILSKFYIKPQRFWRSPSMYLCCILSKFYIKPQLFRIRSYSAIRCILSKFYIKPQQCAIDCIVRRSCILSKFYIKPQPRFSAALLFDVVSYRNSTSNHNPPLLLSSNIELYLIEILHQTTT